MEHDLNLVERMRIATAKHQELLLLVSKTTKDLALTRKELETRLRFLRNRSKLSG